MDWAAKRVLIVGKGVSGNAVAGVLAAKGAEVCLYDDYDFLPGTYRQITMASVADCLPLDCAVISPSVLPSHPLLVWLTQHGVPILSELDIGSLLCQAKVLAVTGTNGKTTTVRIAERLLRQAGVVSKAYGNIGLPFCTVDLPSDGVAVVEVSSFQAEQNKLFTCDYAAVTNIAVDHLARHKTMEEYRRCKQLVLQSAKSGYARNADDRTNPIVDKPCYAYSTHQLWTTAFVKEGQICLHTRRGVRSVLSIADFPLAGKHNLYNALCALALCYAVNGYSPDYSVALAHLEAEPMRMQKLVCGDRIAYNDSKSTNIASTLSAIACVQFPCILLLGGYDKGEDYAPLFGAMPAVVVQVVVFGAAALRIEQQALEAGYDKIVRVDTVAEAVRTALAVQQAVIVFSPSCSSFDAYSSYLERGNDFEKAFFAMAN